MLTENQKDEYIEKQVQKLREKRQNYLVRNFPDGIEGKSKAQLCLEEHYENLDSKVIAIEISDHYDGTLAGTLILEGNSQLHGFSFSVESFLEEKGFIIQEKDKDDDYDDLMESRFFFVYEGEICKEGNPIGFITEDCTHTFRELHGERSSSSVPFPLPTFIPLTHKQ